MYNFLPDSYGYGLDFGVELSDRLVFNIFAEINGGSFNVNDSSSSSYYLKSIQNRYFIPQLRLVLLFS